MCATLLFSETIKGFRGTSCFTHRNYPRAEWKAKRELDKSSLAFSSLMSINGTPVESRINHPIQPQLKRLSSQIHTSL